MKVKERLSEREEGDQEDDTKEESSQRRYNKVQRYICKEITQ